MSEVKGTIRQDEKAQIEVLTVKFGPFSKFKEQNASFTLEIEEIRKIRNYEKMFKTADFCIKIERKIGQIGHCNNVSV